jgi:FAD:protein FMN transferase
MPDVSRGGSPAVGAPRRHRFPSMGTAVEILGPSETPEDQFFAAVQRVGDAFGLLDQMFSRFRSDSELTYVNERAGRRVDVSDEFARLTRFALWGARNSGGLFDPTVLPALVAAGYDRDFDQLATVEGPRPPLRGAAGAWRRIRLQGNRLHLPPGAALDFGGVAKGWAVDRAVETLGDLPWAAVNAGGDLRIVGAAPPGELVVAVEDPRQPDREIARLILSGGAVATSSTTRRTWGPGLHHVIDPRTSLPGQTGIIQSTVWAPTCASAEIRSKWALLAGEACLDRFPAFLVCDDGELLRSIEEAA